ncbi:hypothetical protein Trco_000631 [Trichoderma cornu-damae]|uniref:Helicase C-terminal domain-containing protein n=1 Tax=Trichoderma cornu-damae TaxID=654480 RepID=A0A9P8TWI4_9HYPO|nr:hypothetical protein Trco_000631 [Trichoderma cornu-damae]
MEKDKHWLKPMVDDSVSSDVLVPSGRVAGLIPGEKEVGMDEVEPVTSVLVAMYKLMRANPNRFLQKSPGDAREFLTDDHGLTVIAELFKEKAMTEPEHSPEEIRRLESKASDEQIALALDAVDSFRKRPQKEREIIMRDEVLLSDFVGEAVNLKEICQRRGIDLETLGVNPHNPSTRAKAPQIPDANHLADLLTGPLRAAMLLSECGTGKTFVTLLTLKFIIDDRIKKFKNGTLDLVEGDRVFKPNIIFVPSSTLSQFFNDANRDWVGIFDVYSFYQKRENCSNPDRQNKTIDGIQGLQKYVDKWAKAHEDPETARAIVITSYYTATNRIAVKGASKPLNEKQVELDSSQEDRPYYDPEDDKEAKMTADDLTRDEVFRRADGNNKEMDLNTHAHAYIKPRPKNLVGDMWNIVVADECHFIKTPDASANKLINQLDRDGLLLVSATPLPSHLRDISGYLQVIWNTAWPFGYKAIDTIPSDSFFGSQVYDELLANPDRAVGETTLTLRRVLSGRDLGDEKLSARQLAQAQEYKDFVRGGKGPAYLINPTLFQAFAATNNYEATVSTTGARPIFEMLSVRRGMLTKMTLPDGRTTFMGEGIAGLSVETVELDLTPKVEAKLHEHISVLADKFMSPAGRGLPEMLPGGHLFGAPSVMHNGAVYRRLSLASTDVKNIKLTTPSSRIMRRVTEFREGASGGFLSQELTANDQYRDGGNGSRISETDDSSLAQSRRRDQAKKSKSGSIPAAGAKEVNRVATYDTTGGLQFVFYNTRESQTLGFPVDRQNQVRYVAWESPKYSYAVLEALEAQAAGERLLIYTNHPLTTQIVSALLVAYGVKTLHYLSRHSQAERDEAIDAFNNEASPYTCLVTSLQLSALGVNFHRACHRGLILEIPTNASTLLQATGRLWRIGQKKNVKWKILYARNSFDAAVEWRNLEKYATVLASEGNIDERIKGEARSICAFEIARRQLGQSCSRYPRATVPWDLMDSEKTYVKGLFYSALAGFLFANPGKSGLIGKHNLKAIASAWRVGSELTLEMVERQIVDPEGLDLGDPR